MRRLTLLLCLLVVAGLHWISGLIEVQATTEQTDLVPSKAHLTLEDVTTAFKVTSLAVSARAEDATRTTHGQPAAAIDARPHSTTTILFRSNRRVECEFTEIGIDTTIANLSPASDRAWSGSANYM